VAEPISFEHDNVSADLSQKAPPDMSDAPFLPLPLTPLLGRERECAAIRALLLDRSDGQGTDSSTAGRS